MFWWWFPWLFWYSCCLYYWQCIWCSNNEHVQTVQAQEELKVWNFNILLYVRRSCEEKSRVYMSFDLNNHIYFSLMSRQRDILMKKVWYALVKYCLAFPILMVDDYSLLMIFRSSFGFYKLLVPWWITN